MANALRKSMFNAWEFARPYGMNGDTTRTLPRKKTGIVGGLKKTRDTKRKVAPHYSRQELQAV